MRIVFKVVPQFRKIIFSCFWVIDKVYACVDFSPSLVYCDTTA